MRKTVACKLQPTAEQRAALLETLTAYAAACNAALKIANETGKQNKFALQKECYYQLKEQFGLTANYVVRASARVAQSFGKKRPPKAFRPASLDLDRDLIRFIAWNETVSIATLAGRQKIKLQLGNYQRHLLKGQKLTAGTLAYNPKQKTFHLHFVIEVEEPTPNPQGMLGVDLGINRIATLSTSGAISGKKMNRSREKRARIRASLQRKGTQGAKRALKRLSKREARFQSDVNHCLSKRIVAEAKESSLAIALEDLSGIRARCNHKGKRMRKMLGRWAFYDLRQKITYKAIEAGVRVVAVNPAYTSQTCSACGLIGSRRKHQFKCSCGFACDADVNASRNIAAQGASVVLRDSVNRPEVAASRSRRQAALL
jgi:putative transposase